MSLGFPSKLRDKERGLMAVRGVRTSDIQSNLRSSQTAEETKSLCSRANLLLDKQALGRVVSKRITYPDLINSFYDPMRCPNLNPK